MEVGLFSFLEVILEQVIGGKKDETEFVLTGFRKHSAGLYFQLENHGNTNHYILDTTLSLSSQFFFWSDFNFIIRLKITARVTWQCVGSKK